MSGLIGQILRMHPDATLILDTSPVLAAADAAVLATKVDGTIFVVDAANTRAMASRQAVEALRRVRASVIGAVLNKISSEQGKYYYYYGYYGAGARPKATPAVTVDRGAQVRSR
jgi:Mrp family chromosome partitioning ATPase